jgi:hypothetical protein
VVAPVASLEVSNIFDNLDFQRQKRRDAYPIPADDGVWLDGDGGV